MISRFEGYLTECEEAYVQLEASNERLRAALRALVGEKDAGTFADVRHDAQVCTYCRAANTEVVGYVDVPHSDDCPIAVGRRVLGGDGG